MTVLDGDITPQDISELVALSDHAAFSEPGLARLTGVKEMASALKQAQTLTNGHVYVTRECRLRLAGKWRASTSTGFQS